MTTDIAGLVAELRQIADRIDDMGWSENTSLFDVFRDEIRRAATALEQLQTLTKSNQ
jgi:hypothetical protein